MFTASCMYVYMYGHRCIEASRVFMPTVNPHHILNTPDIDWSELLEKTISYASRVLHFLTVANDWSKLFTTQSMIDHNMHFPAVDHPYVTVGILMCICIKPGIILRPLWLIWKTVLFPCLLVWRLITWPFKALSRLISYIGSTSHGVERGICQFNLLRFFCR